MNEGFIKADYKGNIAYHIATIYLRQNKSQAIGWHMQACLLATTVPFAYKNLSIAARRLDMKLYWRLQNAGDVIDTTFTPKDEKKMESIISAEENLFELREAFWRFESNMKLYLPGEEEIPKDSSARANFMLSNDERFKIYKKLLRGV